MSERKSIQTAFDQENDVMYVSLGAPQAGYGVPDEEMEELILRYNDAGTFSGYTVLSFSKIDCSKLGARLREVTGTPVEVPCFAD